MPSNAMPFLPNTEVYVLAAVNCLAEELNALRDKVKAKADKGTASPDLPQQLQETASAYAAGVTVLRSMIAEVAAVDIEFADPWHLFVRNPPLQPFIFLKLTVLLCSLFRFDVKDYGCVIYVNHPQTAYCPSQEQPR